MGKKSYLESKAFAPAALALGLMGIAVKLAAIFTYDGYLIWEYPALLSGWNNLAFFTYTTNIMVDAWLLLMAVSVFFKLSRMKVFLAKVSVQGFLTAMIIVVGFLYCGILFWFDELYSWGLWWGNYITFWHHIITPAFMLLFFFHPADKAKLSLKNLALWLAYPAAYLAFTMIRGGIIHWYPYPFLNPAWETFADLHMDPRIGVPLCIVVLFLFILSVGFLALKIHNRRVSKSSQVCTES